MVLQTSQGGAGLLDGVAAVGTGTLPSEEGHTDGSTPIGYKQAPIYCDHKQSSTPV